jgi:hypothetical protein
MATATADAYTNEYRLARDPFQVGGPLPVRASWLSNVERRIRGSIANSNEPLPNTGRWLEPQLAWQAINFFQATSDILPGEPYVYASLMGDLIAEFKGPKGKLTTIVTKSSLTTYSVMGDRILKISFDLPVLNLQSARLKIRQVSDQLR